MASNLCRGHLPVDTGRGSLVPVVHLFHFPQCHSGLVSSRNKHVCLCHSLTRAGSWYGKSKDSRHLNPLYCLSIHSGQQGQQQHRSATVAGLISVDHGKPQLVYSLTLSQCTLAGPVYTGMPLVDPVYTGTPLEKLSWNSPTLECHWRILVESAPHWDATGETLTFTAYTGTPLDGLCQPTPAPTHIV